MKHYNVHYTLGICLVIFLGLFAFNAFTIMQLKNLPHYERENSPMMGQRLSRMELTLFDANVAKDHMDKDGDRFCDACGMPIEQCIESGMMECSMAPNAKIGRLGSQHIHAEWKIYINGKAFDFTPFGDRHERQMKGDKSITDTSVFIHIHPKSGQEKAGDILHMHATGVPLSLFFESLGMKFTKDCIEVSATEKYCNDNKNILKFYVNEKPNDLYGEYVFSDLDKILISYGPKNEDIREQLASITSFAGDH